MGFLARFFPKTKPRIVADVAFDGAIRVLETPDSSDWRISEDRRDGDGFSVRVLKYVLPLQPMPLALLAKIYELTEAPPTKTDWRAVFASMFSEIVDVSETAVTQLTMAASLPAEEVVMNGVGAEPRVPLRIRERRSVSGHQQFIVTAIGTPEAFDERKADIDRWFETSAFVPA